MSCPQCRGIERLFSARTARRELRHYRRKGATGATRLLVETLKAEGVQDATLLDVGGGIGAIQHELIAAGAAGAFGVDAAPAYLDAVSEEAERRGYADRVRARQGDFVELAPEIPPADVVTLDKVICCYPNMEALVRLSAARAGRLYGLVYPRETRLIAVGRYGINGWMWLRRSPFRMFLHPSREVDRVVRESGLEKRFSGRAGPFWQVAVYARAAE